MAGPSSPAIVVVGSGLAGFGVLRELRKLSPEAKLTLVTLEAGNFYSKPALSTALAKGKTADTLITSNAEKMAAQLKLDARAGREAEAIDRAGQALLTTGGPLILMLNACVALGATLLVAVTVPVLLTLLLEIVTSLRHGEIGLDIVAALVSIAAVVALLRFWQPARVWRFPDEPGYDLVGLTVDEALPQVDKFLDNAAISERREVRVIHGRGIGQRRAEMRRLFAAREDVAAFSDAPPERGGNGATVVLFKT